MVVVVLTLGASLILRAVNLWLHNDRLEKAGLVLGAVPVALIVSLLVAALAARPFLDRRLRRARPGTTTPAHAPGENPSAETGNGTAGTPHAAAPAREPTPP